MMGASSVMVDTRPGWFSSGYPRKYPSKGWPNGTSLSSPVSTYSWSQY